jgi:hypothetical protein
MVKKEKVMSENLEEDLSNLLLNILEAGDKSTKDLFDPGSFGYRLHEFLDDVREFEKESDKTKEFVNNAEDLDVDGFYKASILQSKLLISLSGLFTRQQSLLSECITHGNSPIKDEIVDNFNEYFGGKKD